MRVCRPAWPLSVIPLPAPWGLVSIEVNESFTRENGGEMLGKIKTNNSLHQREAGLLHSGGDQRGSRV